MTAIVLPGIRRPITNSVSTLRPREEPAIARIMPSGKIDESDMAKQRKTDHIGILKEVVLKISKKLLQ
jgi:hypothetical protein